MEHFYRQADDKHRVGSFFWKQSAVVHKYFVPEMEYSEWELLPVLSHANLAVQGQHCLQDERSPTLQGPPRSRGWFLSISLGQGHSIPPAASVQAECPLSSRRGGNPPVRHSKPCSGPQPCHPVSHLGSFIKRDGRKQPWGKGDLAVTNPRHNEAPGGRVPSVPPSPSCAKSRHLSCKTRHVLAGGHTEGLRFAWAGGWLLC